MFKIIKTESPSSKSPAAGLQWTVRLGTLLTNGNANKKVQNHRTTKKKFQ